jgi:hypothetical protein
MAAVAEAADATRPDMLRTLTKDMLLDPGRRIDLDDLITQEVNRVVAALKDDPGEINHGSRGRSSNPVSPTAGILPTPAETRVRVACCLQPDGLVSRP